MAHSEGQITTADGLSLYSETWLPKVPLKAMLAFFHGGGDHLGRFKHFAESLNAAGYGIHLADLRGHGKSPGKRGHIMDWEEFRHDARAIMEGARSAAPDAKHLFGGHSLGGLLALSIAEDNPPGYLGVIVSAPFLGMKWEPPAWKLSVAKILSSIAPGLQLSTDLPVEGISRDAAIVEAYKNDPLVHGVFSTRGSVEVLNTQQLVMNEANQIKLPLLILHGTDDPIASYTKSETFYQQAGSPDKKHIAYEGFYHEVLNELEKDRVISDIVHWMDNHL